jgi:hypothetical protein
MMHHLMKHKDSTNQTHYNSVGRPDVAAAGADAGACWARGHNSRPAVRLPRWCSVLGLGSTSQRCLLSKQVHTGIPTSRAVLATVALLGG